MSGPTGPGASGPGHLQAMIYSTRFYAGVLASGLSAVLYTVAAGSTVVVRDIECSSDIGDQPHATLILTGVAEVAFVQAVAPLIHGRWSGRVVFNAGETMKLDVISGQMEVSISGYVLL